MIYLNTGAFKPLLILLSVAFLPQCLGGLICYFEDYRVEKLIITLFLFLGYFLSVFGCYKYSKSKKDYLIVKENNHIVVVYNDKPNDKNFSYEICLENIVKVEYHKISSLKEWVVLLHCYTLPQSVFVRHLTKGEEDCKLIGYPDYNEIKALCDELGIAFEVI